MQTRIAIGSLLTLLAACGARQDFSGTYAAHWGEPVAPDGAKPIGPALEETWIVSSTDHGWPAKHDYSIEIRRDDAVVCTLSAHHGGGYRLRIDPGQPCTRGGIAATLDEGALDGHDDLVGDLTWSLASGGKRRDAGSLKMSK